MSRLLRTWMMLLFALPAFAHELPIESLQIGSGYNVITSFTLNQQQIEQSYAEASPYFGYEQWLAHRKSQYQVPVDSTESYYCGKQEQPRTKTCGHIDPFFRAGMAAITYCQAHAVLNGYVTLIPRITGPASYVNGAAQAASNHHAGYDTAHGLSFQCVQPVRQLLMR